MGTGTGNPSQIIRVSERTWESMSHTIKFKAFTWFTPLLVLNVRPANGRVGASSDEHP